MKVLAFDTATDALSVALQVGDGILCDHGMRPREQAQALLPTIERLMAEAGLAAGDLDALVFGRGPGSFTGVRIAVAAAQGYAWAADVPVLGISTLAAIAEGCRREHGDTDVLATLDARMGELYVGHYGGAEDACMALRGREGLAPVDGSTVLPVAAGTVLAGSGVRALERAGALSSSAVAPDDLNGPCATRRPDRLPHARDLLVLAHDRVVAGETHSPALAQPVYLRERVALTEAERGVV